MAARISTRDLRILIGELNLRLANGDPLRDDFRRHGDNWSASYRERIAAYTAEIEQRGEEV